MKKATLVYIVRGDEVLMAKKVRNVGSNYFFGYGGKIKWWESAKGSLIRELWEESGGKKNNRCVPSKKGGIKIRKKDLEPMALIDFYNGDDHEVPFGNPSFRVICYRAKKFEGEAIETLEMREPTWFKKDEIPFGTAHMKPGDELFVLQIIDGIQRIGWIRFDKKTKALLDYSLRDGHHYEIAI